MSYKINHSIDWLQTVSGFEVVSDYVTHADHYTRHPGIEERIKRLTKIVGLISDKAGINLLEIIESSDLECKYEFVLGSTESNDE
jgi:hypothetical protein